jgi:hypothetical protein
MTTTSIGEPNRQALYDTAALQEGLFTTRQPAAAGYSDPLLAHYQKVGRLARIRRGIYCLIHFPSGEQEELVAAWLWTDAIGVALPSNCEHCKVFPTRCQAKFT